MASLEFPGLLRERRLAPEVMDNPYLGEEHLFGALSDLRKHNILTWSIRFFWPEIRRASQEAGGRPLRVLDVGTGGGDNPVWLAQRARRAGIALEVEGCDISPRSVAFAEEHAARAGVKARFFFCDVARERLEREYDVVMCSLFLHHLTESQAVAALRNMAGAARMSVLVHDLRRCWRGYLLARYGSPLVFRSRVFHHDAPQSVIAAFTLGEAQALAHNAGIEGAVIQTRWPCRILMTWRKKPV